MSVLPKSENSTFFKFPFIDNEETDLSLSKNFHQLRGTKSLPTRNRDGVGSSSDLVMGLSPIARNRDSATSIISCTESIEGEMLVLDSIYSISNSTENEETSQLYGKHTKEDGRSGAETTSEKKNIDQIDMSLLSYYSSSTTSCSLQSAMKHVGEHSSNFIDKIRDAAHKRKVAVTRSRDSLVAKEQEQLRSIAECKTRFAALKQKLRDADEKNKEAGKENNIHQFRISELSSKNSRKKNRMNKGFGGVGVPKVEKRPTTTPLSPKLGLRRKGGNPLSKASENSKDSLERWSNAGHVLKPSHRMRFNDTSAIKRTASDQRNQTKRNTVREPEEETSIGGPGAFKARPAPSSTTRRWNAGQMGIPKVSKRAVTVPVSPCLGPKRQSRINVECSKKDHNENLKSKIKRDTMGSSSGLSMTSRKKTMSPSSVRNSPLLGLNLINSTRKEKIIATELHNKILTHKRAILKPFVPRSTTRANMRKQYDISRDEKRALSIQEKRERLRSQIKVIHRELKILSKGLT